MTIGRRWVAAVAVSLLVLVTGCSGEPEPTFADPTEAPASATPTAQPTPEPWEKKTSAGAVAFVRRWIHEVASASNSGDTEVLGAMGSSACETCTSIVDYIGEVYDEGGRIEVAQWRVLQMSDVSPGSSLDEPTIAVRVRKPVEVVYRTSPRKKTRVDASTFTLSFRLSWSDKRWLALDVDQL